MQSVAKVIDFGLARYFDDASSHGSGTRAYMSPDQRAMKRAQVDWDIFALGVILFALAFSKLPFEYASRQNKILQELTHFQYGKFWANHQKEC